MTSVLPVNNVINVTVTQTPSGLVERNVNSLLLLTTETPSNVDSYRTYVTASQVAEDYGSNSETAAMANAIFAQAPNIRTGNGVLNIAPLQSSVSATAGDFETSDISGNLTNFQGVSDGEFELTLNGNTENVTGLDFSNASDLDDVVTILDRALKNVNVSVASGVLTFTSKKVGASSEVDFATISGGSGTDITAAGFLDVSAGTATAGADSSGETITAAINRIADEVSFTGVLTNLEIEDTAISTIAAAVQASDRIFLHHFASTEDIAGICTTIKDAAQTRTRCLLYTASLEAANLYKAAYVGRAFSVNTRGTDTAQTMNLKQLATITPDTLLNQTDYTNALTAGCDVYVSYAGVPSVVSTGGNEFFDNIYSDTALKFALETAGFNHLRQTNTKVPQTEAGINGLKNAYAQVCNRFVNNGYVAPGSWTSSERFGNPEVFDENVQQKGYYIYSIPVVSQDAVDREQRKAPLIQIAIKRAGAVHSSDVLVVVND